MREILFRGKRLSDGQWVVGNLFVPDRADAPTEICVGTNVVRISYDVDLATVGQYTGVPDKRGKRIFEGDIIQTTKYGVDNGRGKNYSGKEKFAVQYADGTFTLENKLRRFCLRPDTDAEVIGNIWDNPELLEVTPHD